MKSIIMMAEANRKIVDVQSVKPYRAPGRRRQLLMVLVVAVLVAALGAGAYLLIGPRQKTYVLGSFEVATVYIGSLTQTTQASGTVFFPVQMSLPSPEEGRALELNVAEGDAVSDGQVLARLEAPDLQDDLEDLLADQQKATRSFGKLRLQNQISLQRREREIAGVAGDIRQAEEDRNRARELVSAGASPQGDLDDAQRTLDSLRERGVELELQLQEERELSTLNEDDSTASIVDIATKIERLLERIGDTTIRSPMDGEVLAIEPALAVSGSLIDSNQSLFTIADPSSVVVELEVLEQYAGSLAVGQTVALTIGTATLTSQITIIGRVAQQSADGLGATVAVQVKPSAASNLLLPGSTAVGVLELDVKQGALLLPRGPYLTTGSQRYVYRVEGHTARRIAVTFGAIEGNVVEILSGVSDGDEIITSGYQNYIEHEQIELDR